LPKEQQKEIAEKAQAAFKEFEDALNEEMQGKLSSNPEQKAEREQQEKEGNKQSQGGAPIRTGELPKEPIDTENLRIYKERLTREVRKDENVYEQYRREVLPLIDKLEADLRQIFIERTVTKWKGGFKSGKRIDIKKRLQEKGQQIPAMESRAWQKRERPEEKDYAISLLVDLSGSMREKSQDLRKIDETFKSIIVLAEALNRLGINVEIIGFNDDLYEYQNFGQPMSKQIREHMGGMFKEVEDSCCKNCGNEHSETDLGWATKIAAERLAKQKSTEKLMIALTDGKAAESSKHPREQFNPEKVKQEILDQTIIVPIDIGSIAGKSVDQIIDQLKKLLEQRV
jgi:nitric oxide reductase activation protein